jgi:hypothetical protein
VKARKVKGLDPQMSFGDAAERIVRVRVDELYSFMPRALDADEVQTLHDFRIAAKRLRYILELTAPCFGPYAAKAAKRARELQDLVGEIHDCDEMLPRVLGELAELRARDAAELNARAQDDDDLDPGLAAQAPNRVAYRGLEVLAVHLQARRALLFDRFLRRWAKLRREGLRKRLLAAIAERPSPAQRDRAELPPLARVAVEYAETRYRNNREDGDAGSQIQHPVEVGSLLARAGFPDHVVAAGILHDVIEDTEVESAELSRRFGDQVAELVSALTEDGAIEPYERRKEQLRRQVAEAGEDAAAVYAADKVSKVRELRRKHGSLLGTRDPADRRRLAHYARSLNMLRQTLPGAHPLIRQLSLELDEVMTTSREA